METRRMSIGRIGEDIAIRFLSNRGVRIMDRNLRVGRGEIDVLALVDGERVAVEVKTGLASDRPEENFDETKERHVRSAIRRLDPPVSRVDLITVALGRAGASVRWVKEL